MFVMGRHFVLARILAVFLIISLLSGQLSQAVVTAWVSRYDDPVANGEDKVYDLAVDAFGDVVVTGSTTTATTVLDYLTITYAAAGGGVIWATPYDNVPISLSDISGAVPSTSSSPAS